MQILGPLGVVVKVEKSSFFLDWLWPYCVWGGGKGGGGLKGLLERIVVG